MVCRCNRGSLCRSCSFDWSLRLECGAKGDFTFFSEFNPARGLIFAGKMVTEMKNNGTSSMPLFSISFHSDSVGCATDAELFKHGY